MGRQPPEFFVEHLLDLLPGDLFLRTLAPRDLPRPLAGAAADKVGFEAGCNAEGHPMQPARAADAQNQGGMGVKDRSKGCFVLSAEEVAQEVVIEQPIYPPEPGQVVDRPQQMIQAFLGPSSWLALGAPSPPSQ